jgi:predicted amidophosphoribosyltransferase
MPEMTNKPPFPAGRELIRCAKCDAENLAGAIKCHECGAHLYRVCPSCGRSNVRTRRHCIACSGRIGRTAWQRLRDKAVRQLNPWKIGAAVVVLAVLTKLLLMLLDGI